MGECDGVRGWTLGIRLGALVDEPDGVLCELLDGEHSGSEAVGRDILRCGRCGLLGHREERSGEKGEEKERSSGTEKEQRGEKKRLKD